ncbi:MAG: ribonuclease HII [Clostridia bacterium]|nr:ribonuclease HII [Clostridia bacterium]
MGAFNNKDIFKFDEYYYGNNYLFLGGIDEAGRGPLAGPVVAACVILPGGWEIDELDDSKKLTQKQRIRLEAEIKKAAIDWAVAYCPPKIIDQINILEATKMAMVVAYQMLKVKPDLLLIDAIKINYFPVRHFGIVKGDSKSASIAAASILAKQARDRYMLELHEEYPYYGFSKNKGYPTKDHYERIKTYGPCEEHRFSFRGIS